MKDDLLQAIDWDGLVEQVFIEELGRMADTLHDANKPQQQAGRWTFANVDLLQPLWLSENFLSLPSAITKIGCFRLVPILNQTLFMSVSWEMIVTTANQYMLCNCKGTGFNKFAKLGDAIAISFLCETFVVNCCSKQLEY